MRIKGFWGKDGESLPATSQICWDFYTFVLVTNGIYITYKKFFFSFDGFFQISLHPLERNIKYDLIQSIDRVRF